MFVSSLGLEMGPCRPGSPGQSLNLGLFEARGKSMQRQACTFSQFVMFCSNRLASYWPQIMDLSGSQCRDTSVGRDLDLRPQGLLRKKGAQGARVLPAQAINEIAKEECKIKVSIASGCLGSDELVASVMVDM